MLSVYCIKTVRKSQKVFEVIGNALPHALICMGITMETAAQRVNYYVTRVATPGPPRQPSVDSNYIATSVATGLSSVQLGFTLSPHAHCAESKHGLYVLLLCAMCESGLYHMHSPEVKIFLVYFAQLHVSSDLLLSNCSTTHCCMPIELSCLRCVD